MSDAHLGFAPTPTSSARVVSFFRHVATQRRVARHQRRPVRVLVRVATVIPRRGFRALAALADVVDAGVPVMMIAGNHDCWGGDVLRDDVGVDYRFGPWIGDVGGMAHAHRARRRAAPGRGQALSRCCDACCEIRSPSARFAGCIPISRRRSRRTARTRAARTRRATADAGCATRPTRIAAADPSLELIVFGHSHVATLERLAGGAVYANPGSWLDAPTFLAHHRRARSRCASGTAQPRVRISTPSIVPPRKRCPSCRNCSGSSEATNR